MFFCYGTCYCVWEILKIILMLAFFCRTEKVRLQWNSRRKTLNTVCIRRRRLVFRIANLFSIPPGHWHHSTNSLVSTVYVTPSVPNDTCIYRLWGETLPSMWHRCKEKIVVCELVFRFLNFMAPSLIVWWQASCWGVFVKKELLFWWMDWVKLYKIKILVS